MKENISFEFIRFDNKTEANIYYRIPKILFESKAFEDLSTDAKYLYSFMLDRVSLSSKNEWIDSDGRIYIIYTVEQVCEILKCGKDKASKLLAELDSENGIGLIERVRRGLCKPDKIYVKDIVVRKDHVDKKESAASENATSGGRFNRLQEVEKTEIMNSEIYTTQGGKNRCQEIVKVDTTNNDNIKTYNIKTDKSNQDNSNHHSIKSSALTEDDDTYTRYEQLVKQQIEYEYAVKECQKNEVAYINAMVAIIAKLFCWPSRHVRINGTECSYAYVKKKLSLITKDNIMYTINSLSDYLILFEKYAEEKGIKVICSAPEDIDELFLPYLRIYSHKRLLLLGMFGISTSIFDIYRILELDNYVSEFLISPIPVKEFKNWLVFYCIPLASCYSVLQLLERSVQDRTVYGEEGRRKEMSENNIIVRKRMIIWGNVQGCGFRRRMRDVAERVGTAGWVRNNPGSSVTVEIQGTEEAIEKTLELVEHSNNLIKIKKIDTVDIPVEVGDSGFGIYS